MFIVLEGLDRSGKATQLRILKQRFQNLDSRSTDFRKFMPPQQLAFLKEASVSARYLFLGQQANALEEFLEQQLRTEVVTFSFPQYYATFWGDFIGKALRGEYGQWDQLNPYITSVFYALDRKVAAPKIKRALKEGKIVISDRYTTSNILFQGAKFQSIEDLQKFIKWLEDLEYRRLRIPRPDIVLFLDVTPEVSISLKDKAYQDPKKRYLNGKKDLHEENTTLLRNAYDVALWLSKKWPDYFIRVKCLDDNNQLLPPEEINNIIWNILKTLV